MLVSEQATTTELTKALSRLAGNRHSDGVSSIVSADDRSIIINGCYEMMVALKEPSPREQALEEAAQIADKGNAGWLKKRDVTSNKKEARDYETMAIACSHVAAAIRALSSQPVANALPQDVINLVIAAREAWETWQLPEEEFKRLDTALEAFASRVPYENEPDDLPASPGASE